jgi:hypothetical protein
MTKPVSSATIRPTPPSLLSGVLMFKRPIRPILFFSVTAISLLFAACSSQGNVVTVDLQPVPTNSVVNEPVLEEAENTTRDPEVSPQGWGDDLSKADRQGAVEVVVEPVNLDSPGETIDFEVVLDTHSIDLSMDLAEMAILVTDTGLEVRAALWDAPRGGHHVGGKLSFPASVNGNSLLEEAGEFQLIISGLDAPERIFIWQKQ